MGYSAHAVPYADFKVASDVLYYSLHHSQICKRGGFIYMRHYELKELFAQLAASLFRGTCEHCN